METTNILVLLAAYLIGTLPTAWVALRLRGKDIRQEGSGNVGAMNTLMVTKSKQAFIAVFLVDFLKGVLAVLAARAIAGAGAGEDTVLIDSLAILGVVLGHNFNIWLSLPAGRIEGGKGLAAGLGGLALSLYWLIPVWAIGFLVGFFLYKTVWGVGKIAPGTTLATLALPFAAYFFYGTAAGLIMAVTTFAIVIKHVSEMNELLSAEKGAPVDVQADSSQTDAEAPQQSTETEA